jgi:phage/plasmid-like protein (TIGR03299 family)
MSRETREWLSKYTLIGYTGKRGNAWHYRAGDNNHYVGGVPIEDVRTRLFDWTPEERPIYLGTGGPYQGVRLDEPIPNAKAIVRSDNQHVLGIFSDGYQPHHYDQWLLGNIGAILDTSAGELGIGSAGVLEEGAVGWVQVEMPETVTMADGISFRPWINAFSSLNGKFATTYKTGITNIVCDNTMRAAQGERTEQFKAKSTSRSLTRITQAREALGLVFSVADDFKAEVESLLQQDMVDRQFEKLVDQLAPITPDMKPRGVSMATKKRDALWDLWRSDYRVTPWGGTGWGAWQTVNTYQQHKATVRVGNRPERNMTKNLQGKIDEADAQTLALIKSLA